MAVYFKAPEQEYGQMQHRKWRQEHPPYLRDDPKYLLTK